MGVWAQARVLGAIAEALAQAGHAEQALEAAGEIADAKTRAGVLGAIAKGLAQAGHAEQALEAAGEIADAKTRAGVLGAIAKGLAQAGHAEQALEAAGEIADAKTRAGVLGAIAEALAQAGHVEQSWLVANDARDAIDNIDDDQQRSNLYTTLAKALARLRRYHPAREIADLCSVPEDRLTSYITILHAYVLEHYPAVAHTHSRPQRK